MKNGMNLQREIVSFRQACIGKKNLKNQLIRRFDGRYGMGCSATSVDLPLIERSDWIKEGKLLVASQRSYSVSDNKMQPRNRKSVKYSG